LGAAEVLGDGGGEARGVGEVLAVEKVTGADADPGGREAGVARAATRAAKRISGSGDGVVTVRGR